MMGPADDDDFKYKWPIKLAFIVVLVGALIWSFFYFPRSTPSLQSPSSMTGTAVQSPVKGYVALTFDDGPTPGYTDWVLDVLKAKQVNATFFVQGSNAEAHPELTKRIHAEGNVIGNHTYSHVTTTTMAGDTNVTLEIERTNDIVSRLTGVRPNLIRYPKGIETSEANAVVRKLGMTGSVGWHWKARSGRGDYLCDGRDAVLKYLQANTADQAVLLVHDGNEVTKCASEQKMWLPEYIDWARAQGYELGIVMPSDRPNAFADQSWAKVAASATYVRK